eukprot:71454_1
MFWLLVVFILQHHLFECYGYNDSINCSDYYNATTKCRINCGEEFDCNNHNIYCPNYGDCVVSTLSRGIENITIYCGYLGFCSFVCYTTTCNNITIHANDSLELSVDFRANYNDWGRYGYHKNVNIFGTNIQKLTYVVERNYYFLNQFIYVPNATNIVFEYHGNGAQNIIIIADYAEQIDISCYGSCGLKKNCDLKTACNNVNIQASFVDTLSVSCATGGPVYGCYDVNINAVNAKRLYIDTGNGYSDSLNKSIIDASNSNYVNVACDSCKNMLLFCSPNNCTMSGSLNNITIFASQTEKLILLELNLYSSTIYANYSKHVNIDGIHRNTIIYATNASIVDYNTTDGRGTDIYASNA